MQAKLYVVVRGDIPKPNQVAQLCHGVAEWCKRWQFYGNEEWNNQTVVCVRVKNLQELILWKRKLEMKGIDFAAFYEPDINDEMTVLACHTSKNIFSKLELWN